MPVFCCGEGEGGGGDHFVFVYRKTKVEEKMGSFEGHVLPGSLFGMVGLWHLLNCIFNYVKDSKGFCCRVWHPPAWCAQGSRLRYVELYIIIVGSFVDMCVEFLYSTHRRFVVDGALNTAHLNDFEHSAMLLMFFLFAVSALVSEATGYVLAFSLAIFLFFGAGGEFPSFVPFNQSHYLEIFSAWWQ